MIAALLACSLFAPPAAASSDIGLSTVPTDLPMSGEVTARSAIVQTRTEPGEAGRFVLERVDEAVPPVDDEPVGSEQVFGAESPATAGADGIARIQFGDLPPDTPFRFRWVAEDSEPGRAGTFRTLPGADSTESADFVVVTGLNYAKFHGSSAIDRQQHLEQNNTELPPPAPEGDRALGYPMLEAIRKLDPRFVVYTGDNVYYDTPTEGRAETPEELRAKWHEQFDQPRFRDLLAAVPALWMKDDHDFRVDDSDNAGDYLPLPKTGIEIFREQVPVVPPPPAGLFNPDKAGESRPTYRTVRVNQDLQIWLVEGRDYRSPNRVKDGPGKTIWGEEQYQWLTRTLAESDAAFKLLISPTPLVGPDDKRKRDNHTNIGGFRHERGRFFDFLKAEGMIDSGEFLVLCGDRHWQYHATHPSGVQEFSSGAIHRSNARPGREAGDPQSTDPDGDIVQHYLMGRDSKPRGGFLHVRTERTDGGEPALRFRHLIGRTVPAEDGGLTKLAYKTTHTLTKDSP